MEITLDFTLLTAEVKRSLAIIGKRSIDEHGNLMFKDITLSSLEEPMLNYYFQLAVIELTTASDTFIADSTDDRLTLAFPSNHNDALNPAIAKVCNAFCVAHTLHSWFSIVAPRLKEKYADDCKKLSAALTKLIHNKKPPAGSAPSYTDVNGTAAHPTTDNTETP